MNTPRIERDDDGRWRLSGTLDFTTVPTLLRQAKGLFEGGGPVRLDLAAVAHADSSALALLIEWLREAESRATSIRFEHLPEQLLAIARLSGVEPLLNHDRGDA